MLKLGDIVFRGSSHTLQHTDGYLRYDSRRQISPNLENSPINVGYQNRFYPPPPSYATETAAIYHRMIHDAYQFVYGIYGEVDAYQSLTGGSFTKVIHKGKGDAHYVALMRPGTPDPGGFGYEAAMFTNGGNGFIATLQGQLGFPDSEPNQNNAVGFQALWGDDGIDPGFVPNYGMFYANNSPGHALMARLNQFADPGVPQIMVTESSFRIRNAIFGSGATHLYGDAATSLSINKQSPDLVLRGHFWDGVNSISIERQSLLRTVVSVLGRPQMYHYFGAPGLETLGMVSDAYGLDLQGHALTGVASITATIGGMTLDFQGGDIVSLDDITFSGSGSLVDLQGGRITGGGGSLNLGGAATSTHAIGAGSVLVGGALEVDGTSWIDGYAAFSGGIGIEGTTATTGRIYNPGAAPLNLGINAITSHSLGTNDVIVGGALEANGRIWADGDITTNTLTTTALLGSAGIVFTNSPFFFSSGEQSVGMALNSTFDQFVFATNFLSGRAVLFIDTANYLLDHLHPVQAHPTVFVHSIISPSVATDQWLSLTHRETDGYIETGSGSIIMAPFDGYVSPARDDGYSLGSQTRRWKDLWVGPGSIHLYQPASTGLERDWNLRISSGDLAIRQSGDIKARFTANNDTLLGGGSDAATLQMQWAGGNFFSIARQSGSTQSSGILDGAGTYGGIGINNGGVSGTLRGIWVNQVLVGSNFGSSQTANYSSSAILGNTGTITWTNTSFTNGVQDTSIRKSETGILRISHNTFDQHKNLYLGHNSVDGYIGNETGNLRINSNRKIVLEPLDGYVVPFADDGYSLGSPTQRWKELWLGPDSLHIHSNTGETGIEMDWNVGMDGAGSLSFRQGNNNAVKIRHTGHILAPDGSFDSPEYSFANDTDIGFTRVGTNNPAIIGNQINFYSTAGGNLFQFTSASILFGGGNLVINSSGGYQAASGGYQAWLFQQQDGIASARVIGSANAVNEYAVRVGTKYTAAEGGDLATLLQVGLNIDSSPMVSTAEFYGDGRLALFSPANTGHAIILRHTGQDGYIQTTLGHISLAPQDGYVNPMTDDAYSLGSPTQRWRELWLGPNSLHIHKPADVNGIERDWRLGIGNAGSFVLKQGNDQGLLITPQNIGSLALGYNANVSNGNFHTAIGSGATASNVNNSNVAIGYNASSTGPNDIAIGATASSSGGSSVVMGFGATSASSQTTVVGYLASVSGGQGIAIGYNTSAGAGAIAIGSSAPAIGANAVAIGVGTGGAGAGTTTVGTGIANGSTDSVAIGANAGSSADRGITIGNGSSALSSIGNGTGSISMGYLAASDGGGIAIGYQASSNYNQVNRSIAIGYNATTLSFANSLAIGESARPAEHNQAQFGTIAEPLNTIIYGNYLSLNNNNKSITLRHINNDGYIQTTSGHLILSPADGEVVPGGDGYGFGNPNNRWYDGYFTDTNTRGLVTDIVHIISANSPYTAKQSNYTILGNATDGNIIVNLPGAGGANRGRIYNIKKTDSSGNTVTIQPTGAQTIDGTNPVTLGTQNHSRQIQSDGLNWYVIGGVF